MKRPILLNAFLLNSPSHLCPGLWRYPNDSSANHTRVQHWLDLARLLERGYFDSVFFADVLGPHDAHLEGARALIESGAQFPVNDPLPVISAMTAVTSDLCFAFTSSVFADHPYVFARRISTLDHMTEGRLAWNIVTSYLPAAMENLGIRIPTDHSSRYSYADEYMEVCYKLWEGSWRDDALRQDRVAGVFADSSKIRRVDHHGTNFTVPGIHMSAPSPQRTPLLFQAGASSRGIEFCTRHAECAFVLGRTREIVAKLVRKLRTESERTGRSPAGIKIFAQLTLVVAESDAKALAKLEEYRSYVDDEATLSLLSGWLGTDLRLLDRSKPLARFNSDAIRSLADQFSGQVGDCSLNNLITWAGIGGLGPVLCGSAERVADELINWASETGVDGFNLPCVAMPETYLDVVDLLVPVLQEKGFFKTDYSPGTFRQKLFGEGDRVPDVHPAAQYRKWHCG